jgi:hypothetical protein
VSSGSLAAAGRVEPDHLGPVATASSAPWTRGPSSPFHPASLVHRGALLQQLLLLCEEEASLRPASRTLPVVGGGNADDVGEAPRLASIADARREVWDVACPEHIPSQRWACNQRVWWMVMVGAPATAYALWQLAYAIVVQVARLRVQWCSGSLGALACICGHVGPNQPDATHVLRCVPTNALGVASSEVRDVSKRDRWAGIGTLGSERPCSPLPFRHPRSPHTIPLPLLSLSTGGETAQVVCSQLIRAGGYDTSYRALARRANRAGGGPVSRWVRRGSPMRRVLAFGG